MLAKGITKYTKSTFYQFLGVTDKPEKGTEKGKCRNVKIYVKITQIENLIIEKEVLRIIYVNKYFFYYLLIF